MKHSKVDFLNYVRTYQDVPEDIYRLRFDFIFFIYGDEVFHYHLHLAALKTNLGQAYMHSLLVPAGLFRTKMLHK